MQDVVMASHAPIILTNARHKLHVPLVKSPVLTILASATNSSVFNLHLILQQNYPFVEKICSDAQMASAPFHVAAKLIV